MKNRYVITIDGYSSTGKTTLARQLAKTLNYKFVDSGAMYRAVTLFAKEKGYINTDNKIDETALLKGLLELNISFKTENNGHSCVYINQENVEHKIREMDVSEKVSYVSKIDGVRLFLTASLKKLGEGGAIVMDGRDIGTTVFPNADYKFFVTASAEIRAKRRYKELKAKNVEVSFDDVHKNLIKRDTLDAERTNSPLKKAEDAITIDNTNLNQEEQLALVLSQIIL